MNLRIEKIFNEEMAGDTSFLGGNTLFSGIYNRAEMRETWNKGIKHGIEIGLYKASLEGQAIELNCNTLDEKHKEFLRKFHLLAEEYQCAIKYHPEFGMVIVAV